MNNTYIYDKANLCEFDQIQQSVRILFGWCEFCSNCANCANCVNFFRFCMLCEFCSDCANCTKSCSNFRTQKERNKEQGPTWFFCVNFLFILKEHKKTTMPTSMSPFAKQCRNLPQTTLSLHMVRHGHICYRVGHLKAPPRDETKCV